jgi:alpha-N-arabinofuranosidase
MESAMWIRRVSGPALIAAVILVAWPVATRLRAQTIGLAAGVAVDATQIRRVIPNTLYGVNLQWPGNGNGMWNPTAGTFDYGVLGYTSLAGPTIMRFPGGLYSDAYHWMNGIGPMSSRPAGELWVGGPTSPSNVGTDEALQFASLLGSQLLITANAGSGTAEEAAAWVAYANRGGSRVKYWEIGNELYYDPHTLPIPSLTVDPDTYAARFVAFASAMKQVDPTIKIAAIGGENTQNYALVGYPNWDPTVIAKAAPYMDYLAIHNAYAPLNYVENLTDVRTIYSAMLAAPIGIAQNLQTVSNAIDAYAGSRASQIRIAVTEWGPFFNPFFSLYVLHARTLGSALFVASTLKAFIESPRTDIANAFALLDNGPEAWLGPRAGSWYPTAPLYALQMYTQHFGSLLVPSYVAAPTYSSPAIGVVPPQLNVPYLDIVSSLSADRKTLYIMAINKHFDQPIQATIRLNGFNPISAGAAWQLIGTGIDANTGTDFPPGLWLPQMQDWLNPRFYLGSPSEVVVVRAPQINFGQTFTFTFQPHSVTSLELHAAP